MLSDNVVVRHVLYSTRLYRKANLNNVFYRPIPPCYPPVVDRKIRVRIYRKYSKWFRPVGYRIVVEVSTLRGERVLLKISLCIGTSRLKSFREQPRYGKFLNRFQTWRNRGEIFLYFPLIKIST